MAGLEVQHSDLQECCECPKEVPLWPTVASSKVEVLFRDEEEKDLGD